MTSSASAPQVSEYETLIHSAREITDELLERYYGLPIEKALDLHTRGGFDLAVDRLSVELRRETTAADSDALRIALRVLDVDWRRTSADQRRELVARAMAEASRATAQVPKRLEVVLGRKADQIVAATRPDPACPHRAARAQATGDRQREHGDLGGLRGRRHERASDRDRHAAVARRHGPSRPREPDVRDQRSRRRCRSDADWA